MKPKIIALLTDFGTKDPFVGIMKAVLAEISPTSNQIDITHQIPPGDIQRGAFVLWQASRDFPSGTIFLCVVDPGVGTHRKALFLKTRNQTFIGPDNGLFSYLLYQGESAAWELSNPGFQRQKLSTTFHGRDIFAPAAAHAAQGVSGNDFGDQVKDMQTLPKPSFKIHGHSIDGEVLSRDHFGNLITSIGLFTREEEQYSLTSWLSPETNPIQVPGKVSIKVKNKTFPLVETFGSISKEDVAGVIGSTGLLEISANQASASQILGLNPGDPLSIQWE